MKIAGIVCEFNPFHYGHKYIIDKIKNEYNMDLVVASMSPNFVMRGEPAVFNKFKRCEHALDNGIDLVLEIPTIYTIQSADIYAYRAVELLNNAGITDLFFGAEEDNVDTLTKIASILNRCEYQEKLKYYQSLGNSFSVSSKKAIIDIDESYKDILESPNSLLGIQYINAINKINKNIKPHIIKRVESGYYDPINENTLIQSATAIRESMENGTFNPKYLSYDCKNLVQVVKKDYFDFIKYKLLSSTSEYIMTIQGVNEGFENSLKKIKNVNDYDSLISSLVSKRNRETKVKRILLCIMLDIKKNEIKKEPLTYVRVLGFNKKGQDLLKELRNSPIPFYSYIGKNQQDDIYRELDFTKIYELISKESIIELEYRPIFKS